jgi:tRNA(adenine34) deaminase
MKDFTSDEFYMGEALRMAHRAFASDEVPIGAVVVQDSEIIARVESG